MVVFLSNKDKYPRGVQMLVELEELINVPCGGTSIQYSREEEELVLVLVELGARLIILSRYIFE